MKPQRKGRDLSLLISAEAAAVLTDPEQDLERRGPRFTL